MTDSNLRPTDAIDHVLTYEEMFQRRVSIAKYREQKIPESAIRNLVVRELDDIVHKSFKKQIQSTVNDSDKLGKNFLGSNQKD